MENKIRFIPDTHIVDYPQRMTGRVLTDVERSQILQFQERMSAMMDKYKSHVVMNDYIHIPVRDGDGLYMHKYMRVKVDGHIYNQIKDANGGVFPRDIYIKDAEKLDADMIEPKI